MTQTQEEKLTACEEDVWDRIKRKLAVEIQMHGCFNADDIAKWDLDKVLYGADKQKVGLFCSKLLKLGLVTADSQVVGRYSRMIWNYRVVKRQTL